MYDLDKKILRSKELEKKIIGSFDPNKIGSSPREKLTYTMSMITFEHAKSLRLLMEANHLTSASGMFRLQYESLVRSVWVYYAASELNVEKLTKELTNDTDKAASKLPMLSKMLEELRGVAHPRLYEMLYEIKDQSWKAMNSYIHSGLHAVNRHERGYPSILIDQVLRQSNGMATLIAILLSILTNEIRIAVILEQIQNDYEECLPFHQKKTI